MAQIQIAERCISLRRGTKMVKVADWEIEELIIDYDNAELQIKNLQAEVAKKDRVITEKGKEIKRGMKTRFIELENADGLSWRGAHVWINPNNIVSFIGITKVIENEQTEVTEIIDVSGNIFHVKETTTEIVDWLRDKA